jgi:two-component system, LytTR family, sensor kinase
MYAAPPNSRAPRWIWIIAGWTGIAIFDGTQTMFAMRSMGMHHVWLNVFMSAALAWLPWVLFTPAVIYLGRRFPPATLMRSWPIHLCAVVVMALISAAWATLTEMLLEPWAPSQLPGPFAVTWGLKLFSGSLQSLIFYIFILVINFAIDSRERLARQKTEAALLSDQLSKTHLEALRRQIEPHFIFNALNSIAGLVRESRNDSAVNMIVALGDFLRHAIKDLNDPKVRLSEEMDFLGKYLDIQKMRFTSRLNVDVQVPPELHALKVPTLILQPLVENAIKHGIAKCTEGGVVRIAAVARESTLHLSVYNDGPLLSVEQETKSGIGLANLRARLALLYGKDFEVTLKNEGVSGVVVSLALPLDAARA